MLPPDVTVQPPYQIVPMYDWHTTAGDSAGPPDYVFTSPDAAYASAVANVPAAANGWTPDFDSPVVIMGGSSPTSPPPNVTYDATANYGQYYIAFYSATCYVKLYWQETFTTSVIAYAPGSSTPARSSSVTTTDREFEWTGETHDSGICLPDAFDLTDQTTWPQTSTYDITTAELKPTCPPPASGARCLPRWFSRLANSATA